MEMNKKSVGIILLAAGSSSRMGQSKQLLLIDGKPLLLKSVEAALDTDADQVVVVLGSRANEHQHLIKDLPASVIVNAQWENGMGSSLKAGLNSLLQKFPEISAVIVMVCDQPRVSSDLLKRLIEQYKVTNNLIVASSYANTHGVPVLFDQRIFPELLSLNDKHGAKKVLEEFKGSVSSVEFPGGEIDLDTKGDFEAYRS
jgi:molybdenum cofactor cytidylyltransferase